MKKRKENPRIWAGMLLVLIMMIILPYNAQAQSNNDTGDGYVYIHLNSSKEGVDLSGVRLAVYQVAEGSYYDDQAQLLPDFSEDLTHLSIEDMISRGPEVSSQLEAWIKEEHAVEPVQTVESDSQGEVTFGNLGDGIYLICQVNDPEDFEARGYTITVEPYLVELPYQDKDGTMHGSIDCLPKVSIASTSDETVSIEVEKHWEDDNNKGYFRPASIQATLYNNEQEVETVTLEASNNWRYVWDELKNEGAWSIKETEVPVGYESTVTSEGNTFIITNRLLPNEEYGNFKPTTGGKEVTTSTKEKTTTSTKEKTTTRAGKEEGGSSSGKSSRSVVKTGDSNPIFLFVGLFVISAFVSAVLWKRHRAK